MLITAMIAPRPGFLSQRCFLSATLHHFWHVNLFHLIINTLGIWLAVATRRSMSELFPAWALASLSYVFAPSLVIGFSNILFALAGMDSARRPQAWWKKTETIVFLSTMIFMLFFPAFSAVTHIVSFALGFLYGFVRKMLRKTLSDYGRAAHK